MIFSTLHTSFPSTHCGTVRGITDMERHEQRLCRPITKPLGGDMGGPASRASNQSAAKTNAAHVLTYGIND